MMKSLLQFILVFTLSVLLLAGCNNKNQMGTTVNSPINTPVISSPPVTNTSVITTTTYSPPSPSSIDPLIDPLTDIVVKADIIVLGTITDQRNEVETINQGETIGKVTWVVYTLSVEKVIKGDPNIKEVFIKEIAGIADSHVAWYFSISDRVLTCLHWKEDNIYGLSERDVIWSEGSVRTAAKAEEVIGRIILIMKENNIPIAFPS